MDECRAENCKAKHPHRRFCVHGHDTFECGRSGNATCRTCRTRFSKSERGRAIEARYRRSEKGRATIRGSIARYKKSEKGRAQIARYERTDRGREARNRYRLLRDRSTVGKAIEALDPRLKELFE